MPTFLSEDELTQLTNKRAEALALKQSDPNAIGAFAPIYGWLADLLGRKGGSGHGLDRAVAARRN